MLPKKILLLKTASLIVALSWLCTTPSFAQQNQGVDIGGYGEMHFNDVVYNKNSPKTPATLDFHRFDLLAKYEFGNHIYLKSELELRHTLVNSNEGGEIGLNQAYLDWEISPKVGIRAGILLVPAGLINTDRIPTDFEGVERPNVEKYIIPTTWKEAGIGIYGKTSFDLSYKLYVMPGLLPSKITGKEGIRPARQNGFESSLANIALASEIAYPVNENITLGGSYYISTIKHKIENGTSKRVSNLGSGIFNMGEGHFTFHRNHFKARGLFALSRILDVEDLNRAFENAAGQFQAGGYIELAYNVLPFVPLGTTAASKRYKLYTFARYESYDTNFRTGNIPRNNLFLRDEITAGLTFKAFDQLAVKGDYQILTSFASPRLFERINLGIAYSF